MENNKNKKYQQLLKTAKELFVQHGIKRVTIEEICKTSGVSKMTFYKYFDNKYELVKQLLINEWNDAYRQVQEIMAQDIPFIEKIRQNITFKIEKAREYGDLLYNELYEIPELQAFLNEMNNCNIEKTMEIFKKGQKEGAIRKDMKPEFYQYILELLLPISSDKKLKKIFPNIEERVKELIDIVLFGILRRDKN